MAVDMEVEGAGGGPEGVAQGIMHLSQTQASQPECVCRRKEQLCGRFFRGAVLHYLAP